ncbi:myrosinase 1-like [Frankliniella occidentalis]|uniref:beta-glucosidase n=1 Tax=Frankliniella occidentalis TaxID=133901 RepID=A0A9C6XTE4_FRAOC|nr:myrosinase 1-like [Frankliniella occidentalis]
MREDIVAAQSANVNTGIGLTIDPLVFGDYPEAVRGFRGSFTEEEKKLIKGRIDFVGINIYGGQNASASGGGGGGGGKGPGGFGDPGSSWVLREMPLWIKNRYETKETKLPIFITENGINAAGKTSPLDDWDERAVQASTFLRELAAGINENGTNVVGYTMWSLLDTFEFHSYGNWGVVHVDFTSNNRTRTLKKSWTFFKRLTSTNVVPFVEAGSDPFPDDSGSSSAHLISSSLFALTALIVINTTNIFP